MISISRLSVGLAFALAVIAQTPDTISTYAGGGPNNVPATAASVPYAVNTAVDSSGNFYIVTNGSSSTSGFPVSERVYEVNASGTLTVVAGTGLSGYSGDGGPGPEAELNNPQAVAVDSFGNIYIADSGNCVIREVTQSTGVISTYAGTPQSCGYGGDGGAATSAELNQPTGVALDSSGNLYIADSENNRVREISALTGNITTIAGTGTAGFSGDGSPAIDALLRGPSSVAVDGSGDVYIADFGNYRVRELTVSGMINTIVGNGTDGSSGDGGPATSAQIGQVFGIASDSSGNVFIADYYSCAVREVTVGDGKINTVAGRNQSCGYSGDGSPATGAQLHYPEGVAVDSSDTMFIADWENARVRKAVLGGSISTVAGNGAYTYAAATTATAAMFYTPSAAVPDPSGNVYIADEQNCLVWKATPGGGISVFAGTPPNASSDWFPICGYSGDTGPATGAQLNFPTKAVPDASGNVYVADSQNCVIRKIDTSGMITTFAGDNSCLYSGDGGPALSAGIWPYGLTLDSSGNMYIADWVNNVIWEIAAETGIITTVAGNNAAPTGYSGDGGPATNAQLWNPTDVAVDASGNLYIADLGNNRIRVVSGGIINTFAGNGDKGYEGDGGPASETSLYSPIGVAVDAAGDVLIADANNNLIRFVDGTGIIHSVAGSGEYGFSGDGEPATTSCPSGSPATCIPVALAAPSGIGIDTAGNMYIADVSNSRIRTVTAIPSLNASPGALTFPQQAVGIQSSSQQVTVTGVGPLSINSIIVTGDFEESDNCPSTLTSGSNCQINVTFTPSASGSRTGTLSIDSNSYFNPSVTVALSGTGTAAPIQYLLTTHVSPAGAGIITPATESVNAGTQVQITATPSPGYMFTGFSGALSGTTNPQALTVNAATSVTANFAPNYVNVTIGTSPAGLQVNVDSGTPQSAPVTVQWQIGTTHTISAPWPQSAGGTQFTFFNWSDGGAPSHQVTASASPTSYTANFTAAGYINTFAGGGPNNVPATAAAVPVPQALAVDNSGDFYFSAGFGVFEANTSGTLSIIAGTGGYSYFDFQTGLISSIGGVAVDASGNIYIAGTCSVQQINKTTGVTTTIAGNGKCGYGGDGGPATGAELSAPLALAVDSFGNVYIADISNCVIREITASTGMISTYAGTPESCGYTGDGGAATSARLNQPQAVTVDSSGNVYIADTYNNRIREVSASTGLISTAAGNGGSGLSGDGGPAISAAIGNVEGLAIDSSGNMFLADAVNCVIREISSGLINTVAGEGRSCGYSGDGGPATSAQLNSPNGVAVNSFGTIFISDANNLRIRQAAVGGNISTIAGNGTYDYTAAITATGATFDVPNSAVADASGNVYITDPDDCLVWKATPSGAISVFAGTPPSPTSNGRPSCGYSGDGGPATSAQLNYPEKAVPDSSGNVYIADSNNFVIRKVDANGNISKFAGNGSPQFSGDGGLAISAGMYPNALTLDSFGNMYIADAANEVVREIAAGTGVITTIAGNNAEGYGFSGDGGPATTAQLSQPADVAVDASGNLYIADSNNNRVRVVSGGIINTFAGNGSTGYAGDGALATAANLNGPSGVAVDAAGDVLIADSQNNLIRLVDGAGIMHTAAGSPGPGGNDYNFSGDGELATTDCLSGSPPTCIPVGLASPAGVGVDGSGNIYIADTYNSRVRTVTAVPNLNPSTYSLTFPQEAVGTQSNSQEIIVAGVGPVSIAGITVTGDFAESDNCVGNLNSGSSCRINVTFAPTGSGERTGSLTIASNSYFNPNVTVQLSGTGASGPMLSVSSAHAGSFTQGDSADTYTITVANQTGANATNGTIALTDTLPAGMTSTAMSETAHSGGGSGSDWSCAAANATCTRSSAMLAGETDTLVLTVAVGYNAGTGNNATTNTVTVSGGGMSGSQTASDPTTVNPGPVKVTIGANVSGPTIQVDGATPFTGAHTFTWYAGQSHTLTTTTPQDSNGTQYNFGGWSDGTGNPTDTIASFAPASSSATYTASFSTGYLLTTQVTPNGAGAITPATEYVTPGAQVQISATANAGYAFTGFSGGLSGTASPQTVTVNAPTTVTANFAQTVQVTFGASVAGLTYTVDNVSYKSPQTLTFNSGTTHTISTTATQTGGTGTQYVFSNWSAGPNPGSVSQTITISPSVTSYTADFTTQYLLTTQVSPSGDGAITPSSEYVNAGKQVSISATANTGYLFKGFSGALSGTANPQTLTVNGPATVTAQFAVNYVSVTISTAPEGLKVSVDSGALQSAPVTAKWQVGTQHTVSTESPQAGTGSQYTFTGWSDGGAETHQVTASSATTAYSASFSTAYQLTTGVSPSGAGTVTPASGSYYNAGTVVSVAATVSSGYTFSHWTGSVANANTAKTTITMSAAETIAAVFNKAGTSISPATLAFGTVKDGSSKALSATLSNVGTGTLTSIAAAVTGSTDLSFTTTCGSTLAAGQTCTYTVTFKPTGSGAISGTLTITDDEGSFPVALSGTAEATSISSTSLAFGAVTKGSSKAVSTTVTNKGTASLTIDTAVISGTNASDFTFTTTCGSTLAAGSSCTYTVAFKPTGEGAESATLTLKDNEGSFPVSLSGTAQSTSISPTTLAFGTVTKGSTKSLSTTVTNKGATNLTMGTATVTGTNATDFTFTTTCHSTLAAGSSCSYTVTFKPSTTSSESATLSVKDNEGSFPLGLTGAGH